MTRRVRFADALALVVTADDIQTMRGKVNYNVGRITAWMKKHGLSIALAMKSSVHSKGISFRMGEHDLGLSNTLKYLSVTFDTYGTFGIHVATAAKKQRKGSQTVKDYTQHKKAK